MNKIIVVGINPSGGVKLLKNSTIDRLNKWMDDMNQKNYSFINLFDYVTETPSENDIDYSALKVVAEYDVVLALGGMVSKALTKIGKKHFKLPHPSPRNRLLNDRTYEVNIIAECKAYIHNMV